MKSTSDMAYYQGVVIKPHPSDAQKHIIVVNGNVSRAVYNFLFTTDRELHRLKKTDLYVSTVAEHISYLESTIISPTDAMGVSDTLRDMRHVPEYVRDAVVQKNIEFSFPSSAAAFVFGRSANGWTESTTRD